ncbi:MAG: hypothetical protein CMH64_02425 [Nanoarchaeota archaeon]|nr:hypothetical protein [Nanoarchaeota archaeon]|tara:strand:+ start:359 stop:565 length:207 start_codon:yes stop_codon:yes gene_type:complete
MQPRLNRNYYQYGEYTAIFLAGMVTGCLILATTFAALDSYSGKKEPLPHIKENPLETEVKNTELTSHF